MCAGLHRPKSQRRRREFFGRSNNGNDNILQCRHVPRTERLSNRIGRLSLIPPQYCRRLQLVLVRMRKASAGREVENTLTAPNSTPSRLPGEARHRRRDRGIPQKGARLPRSGSTWVFELDAFSTARATFRRSVSELQHRFCTVWTGPEESLSRKARRVQQPWLHRRCTTRRRNACPTWLQRL
jgi:hypothetical protein